MSTVIIGELCDLTVSTIYHLLERPYFLMGPALMTVGFMALPLTARCLSPLPGSSNLDWACEYVASDLGLGGGFCRVLRFLPLLTNAYSRISHKWHKCDEKRNSKFQISFVCTYDDLHVMKSVRNPYKLWNFQNVNHLQLLMQ